MMSQVIGRKAFIELLQHKMSPTNIRSVMRAYTLAKYGHREQSRDDGTRYFEHPKRVAILLIKAGIYDHEMIIAALLHDIIEDSFILDVQIIKDTFGERVLKLIKALTKNNGENFIDYIQRLKNSGTSAQLIKLADRADNIGDLEGCTIKKAKKQLEETKQIFLPWAKKLGNKSMMNISVHGWTPQYYLYSALRVRCIQGYKKIYNPDNTV